MIGANLDVVTNKVHAVIAELRQSIQDDHAALLNEVGVRTSKLQRDASLEHHAVREALAAKPDGRELEATQAELDATRQELASLRNVLSEHEVTQQALSEENERTAQLLAKKIAALSEDVDERVAQQQRTVEARVGKDEIAIHEAAEQIRAMQQSKANHEELLSLVQKLQHRPKPGLPFGVTPLLTVPYPLPPSQAITSSPRRRFAAASAHSRSRLAAPLTAELREVPTELAGAATRRSSFATSEQILVSALPADALRNEGHSLASTAPGSQQRLGVRTPVTKASQADGMLTHGTKRRPASARPVASGKVSR